MKSLIASFAFALISTIGMATLSFAAGEMAVSDSKTVKGDLLKIEGEFYTVHDTAGHEVSVHVDKTSKLKGTFKSGDKVEIQVTAKGHVLSMKHVTAVGDMVSPGFNTVAGDLLKIEGEFYTVHAMAGHEVRVHVDKTTKFKGGAFKTGDKVEIQVTDKGHALSINHVQ